MNLRIEKSSGAKEMQLIQNLRYEILRKPLGMPASSAIFAGDELETTVHLLAYGDEQLVGCATLLVDGPSPPSCIRTSVSSHKYIQLRGMAVSASLQGKGIGKTILESAHQEAKMHGSDLWCNARSSAISFYASQGWYTSGEHFEIPIIGSHIVMEWKQNR
jgi:GNAT superfamily N-acetyltransferase